MILFRIKFLEITLFRLMFSNQRIFLLLLLLRLGDLFPLEHCLYKNKDENVGKR